MMGSLITLTLGVFSLPQNSSWGNEVKWKDGALELAKQNIRSGSGEKSVWDGGCAREREGGAYSQGKGWWREQRGGRLQERPGKWSLPHPLPFGDKHCLPLPFRDQHHRQATCWQAKSLHEKKSKMELEITPQRDCLLPGLLLTVNLRTVGQSLSRGSIPPEKWD